MMMNGKLILSSTFAATFVMALGLGNDSARPVLASAAQSPSATAPATSIERLDPALDAIVPADAHVEKLASGFKWTEGPIWIHAGYLLFAEIPSNSIRKLSPDGTVSIFMQPSGYAGSAPYGGPEPGSNGMTLDHKGRLTVAGHAGRNVWRLESLDAKVTVKTILANSYDGKPLNSPNDVVYRSDGSLYFTDPPYGLPTQSDQDPLKQQPVNGVYRIPAAESQKPGTPPANQPQLLVKDLPRPNGIVFSPDEKYLYVDSTAPKKIWMRYPVHKDGTLGQGEVFFDASSDHRLGSPDGMKVDTQGNLYSAGPGGVWIFSPAGKHLGTIDLPNSTANMNWGGPDAKTLYITDSGDIFRIHLNVPGVQP
jgi:gluconolactonase